MALESLRIAVRASRKLRARVSLEARDKALNPRRKRLLDDRRAHAVARENDLGDFIVRLNVCASIGLMFGTMKMSTPSTSCRISVAEQFLPGKGGARLSVLVVEFASLVGTPKLSPFPLA
jgi:hypothetical protein